MDYYFTATALRMLKKIPKEMQLRIMYKLDYFCSQDNPLSFAEHLVNYELGTYRFRIGDYRVVFDEDEDSIVVIAVGHRKEIYR